MSNTEPLDVNKITHKIPHGEMAARTYLVFGHRIACIFYSNISQNPPQSVKSNTKNILPFVRSTVFFLLYFYATTILTKITFFILCSLIQLNIPMPTLDIPYDNSIFNRSLKTCPKSEFFYSRNTT